jgi:sugar phosphate permease
MACLVVAGEAIFSLPFHITRYFRPTFLKVTGLSNLALGQAMAAYGVVAMVAYFPGGPLADRFSARKLMALSLVCTGIGGLYLGTYPGLGGMGLLWGFWGLTSILLFWAALIRATRDWGGPDGQGRAYGILDGGRGLLSAVMAVLAVQLFRLVMPEDPDLATAVERAAALQDVIHAYVGLTLAAAVLVWFGVPELDPAGGADEDSAVSPASRLTPPWTDLALVMRRPTIWLQAAIVVAAYIGYKGTDFYSLFAVDAYGMNEVEAAEISAIAAWVRPVAALAAGLLADRLLSSRVVSGCFVLLVATFSYMGIATPYPDIAWILTMEILLGCAAVYGLRGVYFALFEEAALPVAVTGTAVGIVSVIGYTPDIFVAPAAGWLLDTYPGVPGHQYLFLMMAAASALGLIASLLFTRLAPTATG